MRRKDDCDMRTNKLANFRRYYWPGMKKWVLTLLFLCIFGFGSVFGLLYYAKKVAPPLDVNRIANINNTQVTIKAADGSIMWQKISHPENPIKLSDMDPYIPKALLSIEDRHFYTEGGVNYARTLKSAWTDITHRSYKEGGSTITQQLIKNTYFSTAQKDKTLKRKLMEFQLANELTAQVSKKQILTWYLNKVFLGYNLYGVDAASKAYFGVSPKHLRITQSALLAGMIQSPTGYNPYEHPEAALNRRNTVLYAMMQEKYISKKDYKALSSIPLSKDIVPLKDKEKQNNENNKKQLLTTNAVDTIMKEAKADGYDLENNTQPVTIESSIVPSQQQALIENIEDSIPNRFGNLQAAVTVIDNNTGKVIAQNGGLNPVLHGFDRSTMNQRSTGSTIKPFMDYIPAFELLNYNADTIVDDTAYNYPGSSISLHDWDNQYEGKITVSDALANSRNIPAIKTLQAVGLSKAHQFMSSMGYTKKLYYADGIGLNIPTLSLAGYYASLANGGEYTAPQYITKVTVGKQVDDYTPKFKRTISSQTAYEITKILKRVPKKTGFGNYAYIPGVTQAGKTGTISYPKGSGFPDNAISDSWYAGYTKRFTIVVWNGYDNPSDHSHMLMNDDSKITQDIYRKTLQELNSAYKVKDSDWSSVKKKTDIPLTNKTNSPSGINQNWFQKAF